MPHEKPGLGRRCRLCKGSAKGPLSLREGQGSSGGRGQRGAGPGQGTASVGSVREAKRRLWEESVDVTSLPRNRRETFSHVPTSQSPQSRFIPGLSPDLLEGLQQHSQEYPPAGCQCTWWGGWEGVLGQTYFHCVGWGHHALECFERRPPSVDPGSAAPPAPPGLNLWGKCSFQFEDS